MVSTGSRMRGSVTNEALLEPQRRVYQGGFFPSAAAAARAAGTASGPHTVRETWCVAGTFVFLSRHARFPGNQGWKARPLFHTVVLLVRLRLSL